MCLRGKTYRHTLRGKTNPAELMQITSLLEWYWSNMNRMLSKYSDYNHDQQICHERLRASATCLLTCHYVWELAVGQVVMNHA